MHFDAHVASEVSESGQHIGYMLCVVHGIIVAKKVLHYQNKILLRFQFQFVHEEPTEVRTVKQCQISTSSWLILEKRGTSK